ncbi:MAG: tyrosine-type recombinase/integrase [Burkholderiaceae bacterium]
MRKTRTGRFELTVRHRLLPKRVYMTFDDEDEARRYGEQLDRLLASGIVPEGLLEMAAPKPKEQLRHILRAYINSGHPAKTDLDVLELLVVEVGPVRVDQFTYAWCEAWVRALKLERNLAPGTIRKRIGSLSRAVDWWLRSHADAMVGNPLKLLPRGAATYSAKDAADLAALAANAPEGEAPKAPKQDTTRDRRLMPGELERIEAALRGEKRPDRERPLKLSEGRALLVLFRVIYDTGVRLREAYTLTRAQVDLQARVLRVRSSKQWHGRVKYRDVPMRRELHALLADYLAERPADPGALVFPFWDGDTSDKALDRTTSRLSGRFARAFEYAGCEGLTEHDLRHEATCRWYEMRTPDGAWMFREAEIDKIMGWAPGSTMSKRYASFRAADLAARMW